MGKYLDILARAEACDQSDKSDQSSPPSVLRTPFGRFNRFRRTLSALEARCPDLVPVGRWQVAVEDGRRFLSRWGEQAEALGWTARDLFGLHQPPTPPHPSYSRLSRYDETGLIWLLQGRPVVALTETTAAIQNPTGAITNYRRRNKPALGPVGDSLDDLEPAVRLAGAPQLRVAGVKVSAQGDIEVVTGDDRAQDPPTQGGNEWDRI